MISITTYLELSSFISAFGDGHLNMLVVCSRGGLGKSETVQRALEGDPVIISGHETPLDLYGKLFDGRDRLVVFDEIDGLLANAANVGLLKQVCETREKSSGCNGARRTSERRRSTAVSVTSTLATTSLALTSSEVMTSPGCLSACSADDVLASGSNSTAMMAVILGGVI